MDSLHSTSLYQNMHGFLFHLKHVYIRITLGWHQPIHPKRQVPSWFPLWFVKHASPHIKTYLTDTWQIKRNGLCMLVACKYWSLMISLIFAIYPLMNMFPFFRERVKLDWGFKTTMDLRFTFLIDYQKELLSGDTMLWCKLLWAHNLTVAYSCL